MLFYNVTDQPAAVREIPYTVTAEGISPVQMQAGGVQGEHRATRLVFTLEPGMELWFQRLLSMGKVYCRVDACDGSGVIHRSLPLEIAGDFADYSTMYYDLEQPVTRTGGMIKLCMVFSLLGGENRTFEKVKSDYVLLELEPSPTYREEDWMDMNGLYRQTEAYAEAAAEAAEAAETAADAAAQASQTAQAAAKQTENVQVFANAAEQAAKRAEADAETAENAKTAAEAAKTQAQRAAHDIQAEFSAHVQNSAESTADIVVQGNTEYRFSTPLTALQLTMLSGMGASDLLHAVLCFCTPAESDIALSYSTADVYFSNDDCEDGVFIPLRNKRYEVAIWWNGVQYQGVVRGAAL